MSVFHRVRDIGAMRSVTLLKLATRLGAYNGAVAGRIAAERRQLQQPAAAPPVRRSGRPLYDRASPMANNAQAADTAPPATAASLAALNAQLGANWFSHKVVSSEGETT